MRAARGPEWVVLSAQFCRDIASGVHAGLDLFNPEEVIVRDLFDDFTSAPTLNALQFKAKLK